MTQIELVQVNNEMQKAIVKTIIEKRHSYVASNSSVGRRIDWLIYVGDGILSQCIGMIGIGSSVYPPPKDILNYLNVSKNEYKDKFNSIANNWRFCFIVQIKNAGTQVLKQLRQKAPLAWKAKYGDDLTHIITFVGADKTGAVYLADNWQMIGHTAGLPDHKSSSMKWNNHAELKDLFVKPTGENKKIIFIKGIKVSKSKIKEKNGG
jgi:hypothetical protein